MTLRQLPSTPEDRAYEFLSQIADQVLDVPRPHLWWTNAGLAKWLREYKGWITDYPVNKQLAAKIQRAIKKCNYDHERWHLRRPEYSFEPTELELVIES